MMFKMNQNLLIASAVLTLASFATNGSLARGEEPSEQQVRLEVQNQFETRLNQLQKRVSKMEMALLRIKEEVKALEANADDLIAKRVAELMNGGEASSSSIALNSAEDVPASVLSAEGWAAWRKQDYPVAWTKFQAALAKEPEQVRSLNGLGWAQLSLRDYEDALKTFEKTLAIDPKVSGATNGIGQCLIALGRLDEAADQLTKATEEIIEQYGEAKVVKQGMTASWLSLIRTHVKLGQTEEAVRWCNRYLAHKSDDAMVLGLLQEAQAIK